MTMTDFSYFQHEAVAFLASCHDGLTCQSPPRRHLIYISWQAFALTLEVVKRAFNGQKSSVLVSSWTHQLRVVYSNTCRRVEEFTEKHALINNTVVSFMFHRSTELLLLCFITLQVVTFMFNCSIQLLMFHHSTQLLLLCFITVQRCYFYVSSLYRVVSFMFHYYTGLLLLCFIAIQGCYFHVLQLYRVVTFDRYTEFNCMYCMYLYVSSLYSAVTFMFHSCKKLLLSCFITLQVVGSGNGRGTNPIKGEFIVFTKDLCPVCKAGQ